jgi:hypothetical protein
MKKKNNASCQVNRRKMALRCEVLSVVGGNGVPETLSGRLNIDLKSKMYRIVSKLVTRSTRNTYKVRPVIRMALRRRSENLGQKVCYLETLATEGMCANVPEVRGVERQGRRTNI